MNVETPTLMCPYCGERFTRSELVRAMPIPSLIPMHYFDRRECPGVGQNPRNAETDRRPLWKDGVT